MVGEDDADANDEYHRQREMSESSGPTGGEGGEGGDSAAAAKVSDFLSVGFACIVSVMTTCLSTI